MKYFNFAILFFLLAFIGCKNQSSQASQKSLNGFQYSFAKDNPGEVIKPGDYAYFRYHVYAGDSLIFQSTDQVPLTTFQMTEITKDSLKASAITDVLSVMSKGDSVIVTEPVQPNRPLPPNMSHVKEFTIKVALVDIKDDAAYQEEARIKREEVEAKRNKLMEENATLEQDIKTRIAEFKAGRLDSKIQTTSTGLKYIIHSEGSGAMPSAGEKVHVHYYGTLMDGTRFDDSFSRGEPINFPLGQGQVIPGWDEGMGLLKKGSKATFFIPYDLAYGEVGRPPVIPEKADLVFYVQLLDK